MKKRILFLILMAPWLLFSQQISLDSCVSAAKRNWPAFKKQLRISSQRQLINETLNKNYLPQLNLSGQATYQSETVTFPEVPTMPGFFPVFPNDNYNIELGLNQMIWDGGIVKSNKEEQFAANEVALQQLNVETYGLIGKIHQLYTSYLYLDKSEEIIRISIAELEKNIELLNSAYKNGTLLKSELDNVRAEKLKLQKELLNISSSRENLIKSLNLITGLSLDTAYQFADPVIAIGSFALRPELMLLDAQIKYSGVSIEKYRTRRMPKFFAFGRAGYGRPGYDFMNTDLHTYYMLGIKFSWDIFDWNKFKKQQEQIKLQQQIIEDSKATFEALQSIEEQKYLSQIKRLQKQIDIDTQIVSLKESIYKTAESSMKNGSITSVDYLKQFNEWKRAKLTAEVDKIKLQTAKLNYAYTKGIKQ